jgi:hypothetical protein
LTNTNESATIAKVKKFRELNTPLVSCYIMWLSWFGQGLSLVLSYLTLAPAIVGDIVQAELMSVLDCALLLK